MKVSKIPLASIVIDETLYPRHKISQGNVAQLKQALLAGAVLPPIIVDTKTKKVVDGWHRIEAYRLLYGEECKIEVEFRQYDTARDMFLDAIKLNASQGLKLTTWDRVRSIVRALELHTPENELRVALGLTEEGLKKLMERVGKGSSDEKVPLKGSMQAFSGKKLSKKQEAYNAGPGSGIGIGVMLAQIIRALEANVVDVANPKIVKQFQRIIELWEEATT